MSGVGNLGGSDSTTKTIAPDNSFSAGDNAVQIRDQRKNVGNANVLLKKGSQLVQGSTYITNNGPSSTEVADAVSNALKTAPNTSSSDLVSGPDIQKLVGDRLNLSTEAVKTQADEEKKIKITIIVAIAAVAAVAALVALKKKAQ